MTIFSNILIYQRFSSTNKVRVCMYACMHACMYVCMYVYELSLYSLILRSTLTSHFLGEITGGPCLNLTELDFSIVSKLLNMFIPELNYQVPEVGKSIDLMTGCFENNFVCWKIVRKKTNVFLPKV